MVILFMDFKSEILLEINQLASPPDELKKIKIEDTAATVLIGIQFNKIDNGVRKIPPPVPVMPEANPNKIPVRAICLGFGSFGNLSFILF